MPNPAFATKLQIVLSLHHTFHISSPTVMFRVHQDKRTHCDMRHISAGQTIISGLFLFDCIWSLAYYSRTPVERPPSPTIIPQLLYDHILCDGQCFLFVRSLTNDHPSDATNDRVATGSDGIFSPANDHLAYSVFPRIAFPIG